MDANKTSYITREAITFVGQCKAYAYLKHYKAGWVKNQYLNRYPSNPLTPEQFESAPHAKLTDDFRNFIRQSHKASFKAREYAPSKRFMANREYYDKLMKRSGTTYEAEIKATAKALRYQLNQAGVTGTLEAFADKQLWRCRLNLSILDEPLILASEHAYLHPAVAIDAGLGLISRKLMVKDHSMFDAFIAVRSQIRENAWAAITPSTREWLVKNTQIPESKPNV